jgi:hypothetical protein
MEKARRPVKDDGELVTKVILSPTATVFAAVQEVEAAGVEVSESVAQPVTAEPLIFKSPVTVPATVPRFFNVLIVKA